MLNWSNWTEGIQSFPYLNSIYIEIIGNFQKPHQQLANLGKWDQSDRNQPNENMNIITKNLQHKNNRNDLEKKI